MKKIIALILVAIMLFTITGCRKNKDEGNSSDNTSNITTEVIDKNEGVLYSNVSADELTNKQAQEILEVLISKQFEVFNIFQLDSQKIDETQMMPGNVWYALCTDGRFSCVQDVKDFILQVYTGNEAKWYFDVYLDCEPTTDDINYGCYYLDYDGKLYRNISAVGKGLNYSKYLMETTRIVERNENTVTVEIDAEQEEGYPQEIYKFLLCETPNGWRLDSRFLNSYFPEALENKYNDAKNSFNEDPENQRDIGELQSETQEIIEIDGKYYQSFVSSNVDMRYVFISNTEYQMSPLWDWMPIGTTKEYSIELLGKINDGQK